VSELQRRRSSSTRVRSRGTRSTLFRRAAVARGGRAAAEARVDGAAVGVGGGAGFAGGARRAGRHGAGDGGGVGADGALGTARVVLSAGRGTGVVALAVGHALVTPFLADEEGHGLRVFGDVGGEAVAADARVREAIGVAGVDVCDGGFGGRLQADQLVWTLGGCRRCKTHAYESLTGHCVIWLPHQDCL
jgi:hypothetical protein